MPTDSVPPNPVPPNPFAYGPRYLPPDPPEMRPPTRKRGRKKAAAAVAAVALAAGVAGGATGVLIDGNHNDTVATTATGTTAQQASDQTSSDTVSAVAKAVSPSVVEIRVVTAQGESLGSGVILSADGEILTNNHVIADAAQGGTITVVFNNGKKATATVVGADANSDLALIKAQNVSGLHPATLGDSSTVQVGDEVIAIGSPEGLQGTVTSGVVSYLGRAVTVPRSDSTNSGLPPWAQQSSGTVTYKAIQTDASLNPGNSGGPLLNSAGQVIGINSAIYSPTSADGNAGGSVGLGFSIPINQVKKILSQLEQGGS
ncbi:MAG TPA: trypsin-like peptidase domain-containing protein [Mycobacteriales bacterium]|nr:trypsin-like peptidase domain-containing protein [Mycobacteriales bacterium]